MMSVFFSAMNFLGFAKAKSLSMSPLQGECSVMVVLPQMLMTDFIDWKIKSLSYRNLWPITVASQLCRVLNKCLEQNLSLIFPSFWFCENSIMVIMSYVSKKIVLMKSNNFSVCLRKMKRLILLALVLKYTHGYTVCIFHPSWSSWRWIVLLDPGMLSACLC